MSYFEKTMNRAMPISDVLHIDCSREVERIAEAVRDLVFKQFKRKGAVVGVSGGIDSSVVAALCAHALGRNFKNIKE